MPLPAGAVPLGFAGFGIARDFVRNYAPTLNDEVTVEVIGAPGASKQELYFLALAAANGMVRRFADLASLVLPPVFAMLMIEYDAADHWVRCTIRYDTSMLSAGGVFGGAAPFGGDLYGSLAVYRGPQCAVVGGNFDFVSPDLPGLPAAAVMPSAPQLPFRNRTILTACPRVNEPTPLPVVQRPVPNLPVAATPRIDSPNPKPVGDNRSRGGVVREGTPLPIPPLFGGDPRCCPKTLELIPLVYAALSAPATNEFMRFDDPTPGPTGR